MTLNSIDKDIVEKFKEACNRIIENVPPIYYGALLNFNIQEVEWTKNVAYDGNKYYYNRDWVHRLTVDELEQVILHDILHYVCGHPFELKATAQNPKSVQIYMLECDKHVENLMVKLGYELIIKPNISEHYIWLKASDVVNGKKEGKPWLRYKLEYETDKAKCFQLIYCYNIGENNNAFYNDIIGIKKINAFFVYDHNNKLIRVTRRNKDVKELIEIYNLANKLAGEKESGL